MRVAALRALAGCAALLSGALAGAQNSNDPALDQLLQLLATRRHGHVSFTEEHTFKLLTRPLQSSGELLYDAPDHLEKRTLLPRAETLILDHGNVTVQRGRRTSVLPLKEYPQIVPLVESVRATMAGDRAALEHYFSLQFNGNLDSWSLDLRPADPSIRSNVAEIRIHGARERLQTVEIDLSDGDRSVLTVGADITP
jgi:hypothetical protein